jgi:hypothetical protein
MASTIGSGRNISSSSERAYFRTDDWIAFSSISWQTLATTFHTREVSSIQASTKEI